MKAVLSGVVAGLLVTLAACSTAKSAGPPESPSTTQTASTTGRLLPPRPRDLDLTGVDPCKDVLTDDQLHQLAYDLGYQRRPQSGNSGIHGGPSCNYSSISPPDQPGRGIGVLVSLSTSEGAEAWLTDPSRKSSAAGSRQVTVASFPALVIPHPKFVDACSVVVDVHDGQYLDLFSDPSDGTKGTSPEPFCAEGQRVASMIIQTLSAGR